MCVHQGSGAQAPGRHTSTSTVPVWHGTLSAGHRCPLSLRCLAGLRRGRDLPPVWNGGAGLKLDQAHQVGGLRWSACYSVLWAVEPPLMLLPLLVPLLAPLLLRSPTACFSSSTAEVGLALPQSPAAATKCHNLQGARQRWWVKRQVTWPKSHPIPSAQ